MTRTLQKIGNSRGVVLTRAMVDHLGVTDEVEILLEQGQIRITAPQGHAPRRQSFEVAKEATFTQYENAMQRLTDAG